jgi:D-aminopeptidase
VLEVGPPVVVEADFAKGAQADHAAVVPGAERIGDRTVRISSSDPETAYRGFLAMVRLATLVD